MKKYQIPASITLAQGILESNNGNSRLATKANNHFGIKCHGWEGKKIYADDDKKNECFRSYKNVAGSFEDHSLFLNKYDRYNFLFEYKLSDYKSWAKGLKKAGYATNNKYADLLIKIIEENKLYKYDNNKKHFINSNKKSRNIYLHLNKIKYVKIKKGENLLDISNQLDMRLWQLYKYNDIDKNHSLSEDEIIFIQPKRNKSKTYIHEVEKGETLRMISQNYGVKLKKLKSRNKFIMNTGLNSGDKIRLR
jgi:LysM repeat protein